MFVPSKQQQRLLALSAAIRALDNIFLVAANQLERYSDGSL